MPGRVAVATSESPSAAEESAGSSRIPLQQTALRDFAHRFLGFSPDRSGCRTAGAGWTRLPLTVWERYCPGRSATVV